MNVVITGCSGYIGTKLVERLSADPRFERLYLVDVVAPRFELPSKATFFPVDLRQAFTLPVPHGTVEWCIHLAAVCREPGFTPREFYDTNLRGTANLLAAMDAIGCKRVSFTSTMGVYGHTSGPTDEAFPPAPPTPYGASKLAAELVLKAWQQAAPGRRLVICRPAVIYGPKDVQNVPRMVKSIQKGRFAIPAGRDVKKAVGYVYGLLDSLEFCIGRPDSVILYNYAEKQCLTVGAMAELIKRRLRVQWPILRLPYGVVYTAACFLQAVTFGKSPIHPTRVQKLVTSCELVPGYLLANGFEFKWGFEAALNHWVETSPEDFR